ncbi:MAG TPA: MJ1255/VC2487 family glycosyltransferase [Rheinheimera sp.]|uniref:MJ1255/VC2487 family glycosyltransferase n=1 Tax=Rheinheimera sp. TaxID=1869214 RepID=UPI002B49636F|nr:MJ1255/VC2487 family glycosyltransferase [Rheinheimera sp.]HJS16557.1 MJ1255/VC2487 family glycosyltransferase [Rheinheimera sp.]
MRVLYGVQATGNGHISRARAMGKYLQAEGIAVDFLFSGRPADQLFDMQQFGDYQVKTGLTFVTEQGQISYPKTALRAKPLELWRDIRQLDCSAYDLVLTDFEPITAWAARMQKKRSVAFGHQYAFLHQIPQTHSTPLSRNIFKFFAPGQQQIGLHWHHFNQPILPPIVDLEPAINTADPNKVLVYLPFEDQHKVLQWLQPLTQYQFYLYGPGLSKSQHGHIQCSGPCVDEFKRDLHQAHAVISNAGFELVSEALQLQKRILVKALQGQMEQQSNALALTQLQLGQSTDTLNTAVIKEWLASQPQNKQVQYANVAQALAKWIRAGACPTELQQLNLW